MSDKMTRRVTWIGAVLYGVSILLFACVAESFAQAGEVIDGVTQVVDLAAKRDIVWLALMTAMMAMGIGALKDYWLGKKIEALTGELKGRPCIYTKAAGGA